MVIVVTGIRTFESTRLAAALADRLGWPLVDARLPGHAAHETRDAGATAPESAATPNRRQDAAPGSAPHVTTVRERAVRAMDRRESVVLAAPPLSDRDYVRLRDELRTLRVVRLRPAPDAPSPPAGSSTPEGPTSSTPPGQSEPMSASEDLALDANGDIDTLVGHVRLAFGV